MKTGSVFYGWWVVAGFSFMTFISTGIRTPWAVLKPIVATSVSTAPASLS